MFALLLRSREWNRKCGCIDRARGGMVLHGAFLLRGARLALNSSAHSCSAWRKPNRGRGFCHQPVTPPVTVPSFIASIQGQTESTCSQSVHSMTPSSWGNTTIVCWNFHRLQDLDLAWDRLYFCAGRRQCRCGHYRFLTYLFTVNPSLVAPSSRDIL